VMRATQGSLFHLPVFEADLHEWIRDFKKKNIPVLGTALRDAIPFQKVSPMKHFALLVGNEGRGVDPALLRETDENVYIPIAGKAESLNVAVASGILMYHLRNR
ncbi:MAG TPA: RNA methyltransferase, partial [Bacillales bacterium]|nr:RNA methyltransferase [Bacillales bacterium]